MTATLTRLAFTAEARPLAAAAAWAAKHIPTKPQPAILGGILLEVDDGRLRVSGFDYDVLATSDLPVDGDSPGRVVVSGRLFAELVKTLPAKPVEAKVDGSALTLRCGTVRLGLPLMTGEDYPALPETPATVGTVDAQAFAALAERVVVAADLRGVANLPALTGVYLKFGGGITAMASNRYRGAVGSIGWTPAPGDAADVGVLVPGEVLAELARATDTPEELTIGLSGGLVAFTGPGRSVVARLLDAKDFPTTLPRKIPPRGDKPTVVPVAEMLAAIRRAALVLEPKTPVHLRFEDGTVNVSGAGKADAGEDLACDHEGDSREIAVNVEYLSDGLSVLGTATAELTLPAPLAPDERPRPLLVMAPGDDTYRYFAMPIRKD